MILDSNLILSDAQDASTAGFSENIIDTVEVGDAVNELYFVAYVETQCTGSGTLEIKLITNDANSSTIANWDTVWTSGAIPVANLKDKYCIGMIRLPKGGKLKRYIAAQIAPTSITSGKLDIYLTDNPQTNI